MKLLLDLGNTRLKWAMAKGDGWSAHGAVGWNEGVTAVLIPAWKSLASPRCVLGASVVDTAREAQLEAIVKDIFARDIAWVQTPTEACGVHNAYAEPQNLGVDRFLAMVAAYASGHAPCIMAGIGTALTLDALTADGQHLGGLIAPGPWLMQQSLLGATARVRPEHPGAIRYVANNTADAVMSGCWHAAAALIERFARNIASQYPHGALRLLLDGGGADALLPLLDMPAEVAVDSVLRGLLVWVESHPVPGSP
ncbi:type III pantothenate kinase [Dyella sp. M7H15-1]|uniref:type III pantothenate kinase n=1 Tax=Dyella sp. M7H15-1 TaxID=2501295 RepID=UPI001004FE66|nr:type III pantothenate kinase [Dyella sp. M7H15-1]QAU22850.1 type III pantothenate kinase [Dyella sp. M7H15-1]